MSFLCNSQEEKLEQHKYQKCELENKEKKNVFFVVLWTFVVVAATVVVVDVWCKDRL